ncbi:MAG: hypothetical protein HC811_13420 [Flammeovirgaceae bacterium]|nr:hypothetical protein [Flammeovirgaceae bacterium]
MGYAATIEEGLRSLLEISELKDNYYYQTAVGDFYLMSKEFNRATDYYLEALRTCNSRSQKNLLKKKLDSCKEFM